MDCGARAFLLYLGGWVRGSSNGYSPPIRCSLDIGCLWDLHFLLIGVVGGVARLVFVLMGGILDVGGRWDNYWAAAGI
jgi:hypothetical protein